MQWVGLLAVSLPGVAALAALLFTWRQVGQTSIELRISEQGQITNRYNAAINNLGSQSIDVRLGGMYALQRIMQDSTRDHPTVVSVLSAYVRQHAPLPASGANKSQATSEGKSPDADIQAVINVLAHRRPAFDKGTTVDLSRTDLSGLKSMGTGTINFREADLTGADLRGADLSNADLSLASLFGANLTQATLLGTNLRGAHLNNAILTKTSVCGTDTFTDPETGKATYFCPDLTSADLGEAKLNGASLAHTKLTGAYLTHADLTDADLTGADLTDADLTDADLRNANFTGARLRGVTLNGAKVEGARGLPSSSR
ncbi:pentapeptide repeat-containing protein [Streptomyces lydicus]|uniref:pentapeptide repeat-containing protein n=1 Tax=Streptomyces lydicus TaxID=47763 RepID=UPI00068A6088|nr:pentapeptide repeat-containing protein [Streptomyces lydicus]MDC7338248.1 pentapeptide repeat-containing protein [Streptomyces lydicus]UEG92314.1 pentapeptide repeat-containing protein [Streptomyces lydicus]